MSWLGLVIQRTKRDAPNSDELLLVVRDDVKHYVDNVTPAYLFLSLNGRRVKPFSMSQSYTEKVYEVVE